jgi:hypothetical protein
MSRTLTIGKRPPAPILGEVVVDRPQNLPDSLRHLYADLGFSAISVF